MTQTNKIALITGGSRGLGKNMALALAAAGHHIIITYKSRQSEAADVVKQISEQGGQAAALQLDTAAHKSFPDFCTRLTEILQEKWKRSSFDFLVNNAGVDARASIQDTTEEMFDLLADIHFKGVFFLTQKTLPLIADGGSIINLSTGLARFTTPSYAAYAAMKGAIEVFTRYLAKETGSRGIRVNTVAPGIIETDFTRSVFENSPEAIRYIAANTALQRTGVPDDIGGVVAFLCSDASRWVNAQRIEVSGGMFL